MTTAEEARTEVGLPPVVFMFTIDQIAGMLNVGEDVIRARYLYYAERAVGNQHPDELYAVNIAPRDKPAEWRVSYKEFARYLRKKKVRIYDLSRF